VVGVNYSVQFELGLGKGAGLMVGEGGVFGSSFPIKLPSLLLSLPHLVQRKELRSELISQGQRFQEMLSQVDLDRAPLTDAAREIKEMTSFPLLEKVLEGIGRALDRATALDQEEVVVTKEAATLKEWREREDAIDNPELFQGKVEELRTQLKRARRKREMLKLQLEDAVDDGDAQEIAQMKSGLGNASKNVNLAQIALDCAFEQAAKDLVHFPEQSLALAKVPPLPY
jgi:hypothetical protein